ncbi:hypothetical protein DPMN_177538 [Dreissena polymorpha]|uniref:Uncharacterized protein n=1 Tax=Dreissena polymorpha TaxID=45954 RepID=A0A9D4E8Y4_DREPO|nr:hypothetical protein DPMN_177538 [Dreissena polymorpha]
MEARSLRTNLIFSGRSETPSGPNETLFRIILEFIKNKLLMEPDKVGIFEACGIGGTSFDISRDYPRDISDARKNLWPEFNAARDKYGANNVKMSFPSALVIHRGSVKNIFSDRNSTLRGSTKADVTAHVEERFQQLLGMLTLTRDRGTR